MSTNKICRVDSDSSDATEKLGEQLGKNLKGGETIELISDLGGGKTTLVRGLAHGAGSSDIVSSPTFKISNLYKTDQLDIYHFDFYRLHDPGHIAHELEETMATDNCVRVIEWGGIVKDSLPLLKLTINIKATGVDGRSTEFNCPKELNYLLGGIC